MKLLKKKLQKRNNLRGSVKGTIDQPRLSVFRSNQHIYAQIIDDATSATLASASTQSKDAASVKSKSGIEGAKFVGEQIAKNAKAKKVTEVVFDRGSYLYHGRVKALAEAAREHGLKF